MRVDSTVYFNYLIKRMEAYRIQEKRLGELYRSTGTLFGTEMFFLIDYCKTFNFVLRLFAFCKFSLFATLCCSIILLVNAKLLTVIYSSIIFDSSTEQSLSVGMRLFQLSLTTFLLCSIVLMTWLTETAAA